MNNPQTPGRRVSLIKFYLENMRSPTVSTFHNMKIVTSPEEIENDRITDSVLDDITEINHTIYQKTNVLVFFSFINLTSFYCDIHNLSSWFKHIYLAKHRTISTITTFVSVRGFERKLQVAYRVHLLNAWYIVIFMADN